MSLQMALSRSFLWQYCIVYMWHIFFIHSFLMDVQVASYPEFLVLFFQRRGHWHLTLPAWTPWGEVVGWLNLVLYSHTHLLWFGGTLQSGTLGPAPLGSGLQWPEVRVFLQSWHSNSLSLCASGWLKVVSQLPPKGFPVTRSNACKSLWTHVEGDLWPLLVLCSSHGRASRPLGSSLRNLQQRGLGKCLSFLVYQMSDSYSSCGNWVRCHMQSAHSCEWPVGVQHILMIKTWRPL